MADTPLPSTLTLPCVEESCQFAADDVEGFTAHFREASAARRRRPANPARRRLTHLPLAPSQHGFVVVRDVLSAAELAATRDEMWRSPSLLDADAPAHAAERAAAPFGPDPGAWPRWDDAERPDGGAGGGARKRARERCSTLGAPPGWPASPKGFVRSRSPF